MRFSKSVQNSNNSPTVWTRLIQKPKSGRRFEFRKPIRIVFVLPVMVLKPAKWKREWVTDGPEYPQFIIIIVVVVIIVIFILGGVAT